MFKAIVLVLLSVIVITVITVFSGLFDLEYTKFFLPRKENIKRQVFENTQSYTHGKIQDLAKYYDEYRKCEDIGEKSAIESMINMQFSDFNASTINNTQLRSFLLSTRGY